jgi:hypothetical protein
VQGSGLRSSGLPYEYAVNLVPTSWDLRPVIRFRHFLSGKRRMSVEIGIEPSMRLRSAELQKIVASTNFPNSYYKITYQLIMLSAGITF